MSILITSAYNLPVGSESRILGGPGWLRHDIDQFEIQAKIFTAIREQLGLQLIASKAPVEVIVIDHIEPPSAN